MPKASTFRESELAALMRPARLEDLAREIRAQMKCICNDDCRPEDCDCGGDGPGGLTGCWCCQAYTALNGHGSVPSETDG